MPNDPIYTAEATVTGGRAEGHGRTSDGQLEVDLRRPVEMGGSSDDPGTNPEQLFAIGYAACFEAALGFAAQQEHVGTADASIESKVSLHAKEGGGFQLAIELDVTLPKVTDPEQAKRVVSIAHQVCPYSNATRGNVEVTLKANGQLV